MTSLVSAVSTARTPLRVASRRRAGPPPPGDGISLLQYDAAFGHIVGEDVVHSRLLSTVDSSRNPFFHGGCAHTIARRRDGESGPAQEALYTTSNLLPSVHSGQLPVVLISRIELRRDGGGDLVEVEWFKLRPPPTMPMPAGVLTYEDGVLYCAQGGPQQAGSSGLFYMPRGQPPQAVVTSYYGRPFNSVRDVAPSPDDSGALWFTDPCHGFEQDMRPRPELPCQVYRYEPKTGRLRVMADGLQRPTGLCLSPDGQTVYVTDTDAQHVNGVQDGQRSATIYAFDVVSRAGSDFLANRRVFAFALCGVPIGVRCDAAGNVYAGCADGVEVWNAGGVLLGVIEVPGGVSTFCLLPGGEMFLCAETQLWWLRVKPGMSLVES